MLGKKVYQSSVISHKACPESIEGSSVNPPMTNAPLPDCVTQAGMTIDLSSQPAGIYFLQIITENKIYINKFIIN